MLWLGSGPGLFRVYLAVLTDALGRKIGAMKIAATADDLTVAQGLWILAFAAMNIPVF